jgi:hypothetical protein
LGHPHTLNRRQAKLLRHIGILNLTRLLQGHTADELSQIRRRSNSTTTPESLKDNVIDATRFLVHTNLELHDIATSGGSNETGTNVLVTLLHGSDIAGVVVVIQDLLVVASPLGRGGGLTLDSRLDGLQACEGSEGTGRRNADAGGDGDETLEHCDGDGFEVVVGMCMI